MWRRLAAGGSPFAADHQHVHHLLLRAGHGVNATLAILLLAHAACIACGIAGEWLGVPQSLRFAAFLVVALVVHALQRRAATTLPPLAGQALR
jgi:UDP-GlcNAc:undecaprenyl-phosphate GlcNAc-1-phosphate transferase